jgi:fibronectin-binding autotransporter adhesin
MKPRRLFVSRLSLPFGTAIFALLAAASANAATYYWDQNTAATAGFGAAGGTWNTTGSSTWNLDPLGGNAGTPTAGIVSTTTTTADGENFGTATAGLTAGTITVGTVSAGSMVFGAASGAIVLNGGSIGFGASSITVNNASDTINSTLTGSNALSKAGTGILVLGGTNTRTGKLTISAGTISVSTIKNYGVAGGLGQQASSTVDQLGAGANAGTLIYTGAVDSTNRQFLIGDATAANTGGATFTNNGSGLLTFNATNFNPTIASITATRTLTFNGTADIAVTGILQNNAAGGLVALTKSGANVLTLGGTNTFTGATSIGGGTLRLGSTGALASTSGISMTATSSLAFGTDTAFTTLPLLSGSSAAATYTLVSDRATSGAALTHALGAANLGNATWAFTSGSNVASGTAGLSITGVTMSGGAIGTVTLTPTTSTISLGTVTASATAKTLALDGTGTGSITGAITAGTGVTLTKANSSTWTISGTGNTYAGGLSISAGQINLNSTTALGAVGGTFTITGGTIDNTTAGSITHANNNPVALNGNFTFGGTQSLNLGTGAVTMNAARTITTNGSGTLTLGGGITGATFGITKAGAGTLSLSGVIGTTSGGLTVNAGTLIVGNAANTFTGAVTVDGATSVLQMTSGSNGTATAGPLGIASTTTYKTVTLNNGGTFRPSANFNDNAPTASAAGSYVFNIGSGGGAFNVPTGITLTLDDGSGTGTASTNAQLQGAGTLTKTGVGTLSLGNGTSNFAAFTGAIIVNAGTLTTGAASTTPLGTIATGTTINSGAALNAGAAVWTAAEPLTINGTGLASAPAGALTASGAATWIGPVTLGSNATIGGGAGALTLSSGATINATAGNLTLATGAGTLTLNGTVNLGSNTLTMSQGAGRTSLNSTAVISGTGSVVVNGTGLAGDWANNAVHTYQGGTTLNSGSQSVVGVNSVGVGAGVTSGNYGTGTLILAGGAMRGGTGGLFTVGNNVTLQADTTFYTTASERGLSFAGATTITGATRTITSTVGTTVAGTTVEFSGAIGDGGNTLGLVKAGAGNLTLSAVNTYTGGTTVNAGNLTLRGSVPTNTALSLSPTVAGGAVFSLASNSANPLTDVSTLTIGSASGPTGLGFELGANTAASDSITTPNAATTSGTVNISILPLAGFGSASTYDLLTAPSGLDGATYALTNAPGGYSYSLVSTATSLQLALTPVVGDLYWRGNSGSSWSSFTAGNTNWFTDAAGSTNAQSSPGAGNTVNFSTANAPSLAGAISTTLDNNFTVNDLVFSDSPNGIISVTIAPGVTPAAVPGILAVAPSSSADGITVGSNAGAITISAPVILGANQTWSVDGTGANGSSLTVSGAITGSGTLGISGLVTLSSAANTYSGATTVPNGGILQGGATNSFSASSAVTVSGTGILRLNGFSNTILSLAGDGTVQNNHASTAVTLTAGDATDTTFSGTLQNGGAGNLALNKTGAGVLTLSGTNTNTGGTTITAGTIRQGVANALTSGTGLTANGTSVFDLNGFDASVATLGGVSTATVTDNAAGPGTSTLSITNAGSSATAITNGATRNLALRVTNGLGNFVLTNSGNTFSGGIVLTHNATGTRMSLGTVTAGAHGTGAITIGESPTDKAGIYFTSATQTLTNPIIFNTALGNDRVGIRTDVAGITLSGVITANLAPATFTANNAGSSFTLTNQVTGASGLVLDITSLSAAATTFQVTLNNTAGTNNYQGDTIVNLNALSGKSATLQLLAADQIPNGSSAGNVFVNSNGTGIGLLSLAGGNETINGLNGSGNVASTSGTVTLTLGDNNATGNHSGSINNTAGTLSVTKIGTGMQTLSGASNFAGALTVNGGIVAFPSSPATSGPLGNSTVVNLNDGAISYTSAGANALNRTLAIGASNGTVDVQNATGVLSMAGASVTSTGGNLLKTGAGTVAISGTTTLSGGAASVAVNAGTLQAGFGTAGVATITVGATGNLDQRNAATEALVLSNVAGALTVSGGASLGFEFDGANNDKIDLGTTGTAVTSGVITLNLFNTGSGIAAGTYDLLTSVSGGLDDATYALGSAPNGFNYTINVTDTNVSVTVTNYTPIFWRGGQDLSWNTLGAGTANWTTDSAGAVDAVSIPTTTDTVILSAAGAPTVSNAISTTLDAAFTVDSLQFSNVPSGITAVTIAAGTSGSLTLSPLSTSGGIRVLSGGGIATISAPLTTTTAQTWDVDPTGSLIISGDTTFTGSVNKTNTGALTLSGTNSGAGAFTLTGGTLNLNSATALGSGLFTIGAGTTLNTPTAAITLANNNAQVWNGDYTFTGANNLNLGTGAVLMSNSVALTATASTLTVGGIISDGGNNRGLTKAGSGTLLLNGANSYGGLTNITAGVLRITSATGLGAVTGGVTQSGTSALELDGTGGDFSVGAEALTINGGGITDLGALRNIAGNNTYGGTVTMAAQSRINSDSGTLTLDNATAVTAPNLTLVVGGAGNTTISGNVTLGSGGISKGGAGVLTLGGANTYTGTTGLVAGTLNITGSWTGNTTSSTLSLGGAAGNTVTNVSGNITAFGFAGGAVNGAVAVYNQTAGLASFAGNITTAVYVANNQGSYGYLNITGGTFKSARRFGIAQSLNVAVQSTGMVYVGGTGFLDMTNSEWALNYSHGHVTVAGSGLIDRTGAANPYGIIMNSTVSGGQYGVLNVAGGSFVTTTQPIQFGNNTTAGNGNNNTALINLAGGTLQVGVPLATSLPSAGANQGYLNFAGGTLKTSAAVTNWIPTAPSGITFTSNVFGAIDNSALAGAPSFSGGLTFDSNGFDSSLGTVLGAATGNGVAQSSLTVTPGTGYVGAPEVIFSGGTLTSNGTPAAGYALVSGGAVTGIVITSPGTYTVAPSVTLVGGGGTGANVAVGTLVANTSGGFTKTGLGTLTLSGANTYTGATVVNGGTLQLNGSAAGTPTTSAVTVGAGGTLGFTAAAASTLDLATKSLTLSGGTLKFDVGASGINDTITVQDFTLTANSALTFSSLGGLSEGGSYTLLTSANPITNAGSFTLSGQTIGRVTLTPTINANTITVATSVDESQWGVDGGGNWSLAGNWTGYLPETAGDAALFGSGITAPATVSVDTPQSVGYIRFNNTNSYTIGSNASNFLTLNNGASPAVVTVSSGSHTIAENVVLLSNMSVAPAADTTLTVSGVISGAGRTLDVNGSGTLVLSAVNTYTGATTVTNATLSLTGSLTAGAAVTINGSGVLNQSATGIISGAATVTHNSTGSSVLAGVNTYSGATTVGGGSLTLSGARTGSSGAFSVGTTAGQNATLNISNGSYALGGNAINVGNALTTAATATVNQSAGAISFTSGNAVLVGMGTVGNQGVYNLSGGSITTFASTSRGVMLGVNSNPTPGINSGGGTFNLSGTGTLNMTAASGGGGDALLEIGRSDTVANNTTNAFNQTGGTANVGILTLGGAASGSSGVNAALSLTAGTFRANQFTVLSAGASNASTITIGGTALVTLPAIPATKGAGSTAAITFDSTTGYLRPTATSATYMPAGVFNSGAKLTANGAKIDTNGFDITIGQVLEDDSTLGTLTKSGLGNLTLAGVNTYTGTTTINAGTLTINEGSIAGSSSIENNGALVYALTTNARTYANAITGSGSLTKSGTNSLTLSGTNSYTGNTNVSGGTLLISGATNTGSSILTVGSGTAGAMTVATGGSFTTTGPLNLGSGAIGNTLTVQTGATMNLGSIANPWGASYAVSGTLTSAGAWTVSTNRTTDTFNGSGTINAASLTLGNASTGVNYSGTGVINITGAVTVACNLNTGAPFYSQSSGTLNAGSMVLGDNQTNTTGSRTFSLTGGRVNLGAGGISSTGTTTATRIVNLGTGTLGASADWSSSLPMNLTTVAGVTINTLDSVDNTTARTITLSGVLSGTSNSLTKDGDGTLILTAANTYSGATTINAGTLQLGDAGTTGVLAPTSAITNNGNLTINRTNTAVQGTAFGTITGTGSLTQAGSGTTTLNAANTYTGNTILNAGLINLAVAEIPGTSGPLGNQLANAAGTIVFGGGTLQYSATNQFDYSGRFSTAANQAYRVDTNAQTVIWATDLTSSNGSLTKSNTGTLTLSGANSYSGANTITGGTVQISAANNLGDGSATNTISLGAATLRSTSGTYDLGANRDITLTGGAATLRADAGVFTVSGDISNGANGLTLLGLGTNPLATGNVVITGVIGTGATPTGGLTIGSTSVSANVTLSGNNLFTGNITLPATNVQPNSILTVTNSGALGVGPKTLQSGGGGEIHLQNNISLPSDITLTVSGNPTQNNVSVNRAVIYNDSGTNVINGNVNMTSGNGGTIIESSSGLLTINGNVSAIATGRQLNLRGSGDGVIAGDISNGSTTALPLVKDSGTGTWTLSGANTYTGATTVSVGTLALVGGSQASPITVSAGASLGFTLDSPTTSTSSFNLTNGTIKITGTPTLPSYTLISSSTGITGTPTLDAAIPGYVLKVVGNTLVLENPYEAWVAANGATGGKAADPDGDGFNNLMEFAFGSDPTVNSAGSIAYSGGAVTATGQPVLEEDGGIYYAVFGRRTDYAAAGLTYTVQFTAGLDQWTSSVTVPTVIATDGTIDAVRVPFPNSVASPSGPKKPYFFRVMIAD